jgi:hypothetical protein
VGVRDREDHGRESGDRKGIQVVDTSGVDCARKQDSGDNVMRWKMRGDVINGNWRAATSSYHEIFLSPMGNRTTGPSVKNSWSSTVLEWEQKDVMKDDVGTRLWMAHGLKSEVTTNDLIGICRYRERLECCQRRGCSLPIAWIRAS